MKTLSPKTVTAVNTLYKSGAFLLRVGPSNKPAESRGFFDRQPSLDDLLSHLETGHRLGIEPSSIGAVAVDIDDGDPDHFLQNFRPLSVYQSKTEGRVHAFYAHDGARISPRPFDAPVFKISGDLKHTKSYVALYDTQRLAEDITNGSLGVPYQEVERALVNGQRAAQGGQRGPLTPSVGSPERFNTFSGPSAA